MVARPHLLNWRSARWLVLLLFPIAASAAATVVRGFAAIATIGIAVIGIAVALCLFAAVASGIESSDWGTFLRRREPIRYWIGVLILAAWYLGMCAAGWVLRIG